MNIIKHIKQRKYIKLCFLRPTFQSWIHYINNEYFYTLFEKHSNKRFVLISALSTYISGKFLEEEDY